MSQLIPIPPIPLVDSSVSLKDWLLIIGPLVGVLIGGLITSVIRIIELYHARKEERTKLLINRLEDLFHAITQQIEELTRLGPKTIELAISETTDMEFQIRKNAFLTGYHSQMLITANSVVLYSPQSTANAGAVLEEIGKLIDSLAAFLNHFSNRQKLPSAAILQTEYDQLREPILSLSRAMGKVQSELGMQLHSLLGITAPSGFWNVDVKPVESPNAPVENQS